LCLTIPWLSGQISREPRFEKRSHAFAPSIRRLTRPSRGKRTDPRGMETKPVGRCSAQGTGVSSNRASAKACKIPAGNDNARLDASPKLPPHALRESACSRLRSSKASSAVPPGFLGNRTVQRAGPRRHGEKPRRAPLFDANQNTGRRASRLRLRGPLRMRRIERGHPAPKSRTASAVTLGFHCVECQCSRIMLVPAAIGSIQSPLGSRSTG